MTGSAIAVTEDEVRASVRRVIDHAESIWDEWAWQVENKTWIVLGYESWDAMRAGEYGTLTSISAPRAERPELVARFRSAGLTQKQTADTLGVTERTVRTDEPAGLRGARGPTKTGRVSGSDPTPDPVPDAPSDAAKTRGRARESTGDAAKDRGGGLKSGNKQPPGERFVIEVVKFLRVVSDSTEVRNLTPEGRGHIVDELRAAMDQIKQIDQEVAA